MNLKLMALAMLLMVVACNPSKKETEETAVEDTQPDLSGITYYDLLTQVFEDDGYSFNWDGEALPNDFVQSLTITKEGPCGSGECGELLSVTNTSATDTLEIIVKGAYDLDGNTGQITRQYVIPANEKISIGCSHLCVEKSSYPFDREIIGSKIFKEVE